ncbi:MAG: PQQ-binding-like beta-propeller repeat protein [Eubacteriales bacterium]|nr:PQQ-binding-like beta-propeller repeat protein [Eubacteriales bacterium]
MKKKGRVILAILMLFAVCVFAVFASGIKIGFIENYTYNFKMNILGLVRHFNIELSEQTIEFLQDLPSPEPAQVTNEPLPTPVESNIETVEDIPDVEFEDIAPDESKSHNTPVAIESAYTYKYSQYRDYILCVNETSVLAYNRSGKSLWAIGIHMSDPILSVSGNYYMIAERGGRKIALFDGKKQVFQTEADGEIKTAELSENGDIVVVSDKEYYKGAVIVINRKGDKVFSWNSGHDSIIDADIASGSRRVAVSFLNTEIGANSRVEIFNISNGKSEAKTSFDGSIVYDVDFLGEVLNVFADDKVCGVSQRGKILWEKIYTERELLHHRAEDSGYKLMLVENNNVSEIEILTGRGGQKSLITAEKMPDCIDIRSGRIAYNIGRDLILSGFSGRHKKIHTCPREIRDVYVMDNDHAMVVYSSGLDFIDF